MTKRRFRQAVIATTMAAVTVNVPVVMGVNEVKALADENIQTIDENCKVRPNTPGYMNTPGKDSAIAPGVFEYTQKTLDKADLESKLVSKNLIVEDVENTKSATKKVKYQWKETPQLKEFLGWKAGEVGDGFTIVEPGEAMEINSDGNVGKGLGKITKVYPYDQLVDENGKKIEIETKDGTKIEGTGKDMKFITARAVINENNAPGNLSFNSESKRYIEIGREKGVSIKKTFKVNPNSNLKLSFAYKAVFTQTGNSYSTGERIQGIVTGIKDDGTRVELAVITSSAGFRDWQNCGAYFKVPNNVNKIEVKFVGDSKSTIVKNKETKEGFPNKDSKKAGIGAFLLGEIFLGTAAELEMKTSVEEKKDLYKIGDKLMYNMDITNVGCESTGSYATITTLPEEIELDGNPILELDGKSKELEKYTIKKIDGKTQVKVEIERGARKDINGETIEGDYNIIEDMLESAEKSTIKLKLKVKDNVKKKVSINSELEWTLVNDIYWNPGKDKSLSDYKEESITTSDGKTRLERDVQGEYVIRVTPNYPKQKTFTNNGLDFDPNKRVQKIKCINPIDINIDTLNIPDVTEVADKNILTPEEVSAVKKAIMDANPGINEDQIEVVAETNDGGAVAGTAIIKDGDLVIANFGPEVTIKKKLDAPDKIVANPENLTGDEKKKLEEKIIADVKAKNPDLSEDTKIVVDLEKGTVEVKDKDNNVLYKFEDVITKLGNPKITQVLDLNDIEKEKDQVVEKINEIKDFPTDAKIDVVAKTDGEKKAGTVIVTVGEGENAKVIARYTPEETIVKMYINRPNITKVLDINKLTEDDKTKVKEAIKKVNKELTDDQITVDDNGKATITIDGIVVKEFKQAETVSPKEVRKPDITIVKDKDALTKEEQDKVIEAIKKANLGLTDDQIVVDDKGNATITISGVESKFLPEDTVKEGVKLNEPDITIVKDKEALTEDEKKAVENAVKDVNPDIGDITVEPDGTVKKGEKTIFTPGQTVKQGEDTEDELNEPNITIVKDKEALTEDEKKAVENAVKDANPDIGDITVELDGTVKKGEETIFIPDQTVKQETNLELPSITRVYDLENLTPDEKKAVENAVKDANPNIGDITVEPNGTVKKDKEIIFIPDQTVAQKEIHIPGKTVVVDKSKLTEDEKKAVEDAVKEVNPGIGKIDVNDDGSVEQNKEEILTQDQTVEQRFNEPAKTTVEDKKALTDAEKEKVKDKVADANPNVDKESIVVDDDGSVTIGGKKVFTPEQTVIKKDGGSHSNNGGGGGGSYTKPSHRLSDKDRIGTAVKVSKASYSSGSNAVIIVNMDKFADVLTATPFAVHINAPILFVHKDSIPAETMDEIKRLGATKVYIAGGEASVSKKVAEKFTNVHRFNGSDRYDTAKLIAESIRVSGNKKIVEIASGETFPDALSMSALAVRDDAPILLVKKDDMTAVTRKALTEWKDIERINVAGYHATISQEVEKSLGDIHKSLTFRYGGADRYETSAIIAKEARKDSRFAVYTSGEVFADALVAAPYAGKKKAPVLLVQKENVPKIIKDYTEGSKIRDFKVVGGEDTVKQTVIEKLLDIIK